MKKLLITLLAIGSFSTYALDLVDVHGEYTLQNNSNNSKDCAGSVIIDSRGKGSDNFAIISRVHGSVGHMNVVNLDKSEKVKVRFGVYHKYTNNLKDNGTVVLNVYGLLKMKRNRSLTYDFSDFSNDNITITEAKGRRILEQCSYTIAN